MRQSLVSRDRDKGFLWRPRDVYILHKNKNTQRSPCGENRQTPTGRGLLSSLLRASGLTFSPRGAPAIGLQTPTFPKSEGSGTFGHTAGGQTQEPKWGLTMTLVPLAPCKQIKWRGTRGWDLKPSQWGQGYWGCPPPALRVSGQVSDVAPAAWLLLSELVHRSPWTSRSPQPQTTPSPVRSPLNPGQVRPKENSVRLSYFIPNYRGPPS